tara:strand:+ start:27612 stop:27884 length:273 start_codon:yes stop_codon:yes gene_type:complete
MIKKKNNNRQHTVTDYNVPEASEDNHAFLDESLNLLYDAIKQLSEIDRAVILLYLEERPHKEIAEIIGTSHNNIAVRITRIKERLKKILN